LGKTLVEAAPLRGCGETDGGLRFMDDGRLVRTAAAWPSDAGRAAQGPSPAVSRAVSAASGLAASGSRSAPPPYTQV
jgi:hypothetical protein